MWKRTIFLFGLALGVACNDGKGAVAPPVSISLTKPAELKLVSGDDQKDTVVHTFKFPVVLRVIDSLGRGIPRVVVNMFVVDTDGVPLLDARKYGYIRVPAEISNDSGEVGANVVLGTLAYNIIIKASYNDPETHEEMIVRLIRGEALPDTASRLDGPEHMNLVSDDSLSIGLIAKDAYGNASGSSLSWSSDNTAVATVSGTGVARGLAPGEASLRAITGSVSASVPVLVTPKLVIGALVYISNGDAPMLEYKSLPLNDASTKVRDGLVYSPRWSPDGTKLAFLDDHGQIVVTDNQGRNSKVLATNFSTAKSIAWSPSGDKIGVAYGEAIYRVDAVSGVISLACQNVWPVHSLDWSRQDRFVFAAADGLEGKDQIFVSSEADCSSITKLTSSGENLEPRWSPDGTKIVFVSDRSGCQNIYVMLANGNNQHAVWSAGMAKYPTYSPDGSFIAFSSTSSCESTMHELYIMGSGGETPVKLWRKTSIASLLAPDWR